jgi:DNA repair ATPase RecN
LEDKARIEEIARMLAGLEGSTSAQEHAVELLAMRESIS